MVGDINQFLKGQKVLWLKVMANETKEK